MNQTISPSQTPLQHLAIIPDGNRRWAKKHAITAQHKIYEQGSAKTDVIERAFDAGVRFVTFWASSYANLAERPKGFVNAMEAMYAQKFRELAANPLIHANNIRIEILGEWRDLLQSETTKALQDAIDATIHYSDRLFTILVGYDGRRERGAAINGLLGSWQQQHFAMPADTLAAETALKQHAWTGHLPEVDLVVRTGAWEDPHNSAAFLSLLTAESQYAYPQVLWPDFTPDLLSTVINDFTQRERRKGR